MKARFFLAALAVPVAFAGYVTFHPGVAFAAPVYASTTRPQTPGEYTIDPAHTSIGFEIGHLGISSVQGRFVKKEGKLHIDKDLTRSSVDITVQTASVDTGVEPRDNHLRSKDFFEVEKYPTMTFKSSSIRKAGEGYVADGRLTIKGVSKTVAIPFRYFGPITDPWGGTRVGVIAQPITVDRQAFGIAYDQKLPDGTPAVANAVKINVSLEATLDKASR